MAVAADVKCYRLIVIVLNALFLLCGIAFIAVGAYSIAAEIDGFEGTKLGAGLIVLGVFIFFISLAGCLGAIRCNRGLLKLFWRDTGQPAPIKKYFALVLILLIIQIGLAIAGYVYRDEIPELANSAWNNNPESREAIEDTFDCCGWYDPTDRATANCSVSEPPAKGCQEAVEQAIEDNYTAIAGTAIGVGVFQLLILVLSCCLIQRLPTKAEQEQQLLDEARINNREGGYAAGGQTPAYGSYA